MHREWSRHSPIVIMDWHQGEIAVKDTIKSQNPLLTAFQYKKPLRHNRRRSSTDIGTSITDNLVDRIHQLSDSLRTDLAPKFDQLENDLVKSVGQVREKVNQLDELHSEVHASIEAFVAQTESARYEVEGELERLKKWSEQPRDIEALRVRLESARQQLQTDTTRLEKINREISQRVSQKHASQRVEIVRYRLVCAAIVALFSVLLYFVFKPRAPEQQRATQPLSSPMHSPNEMP